jgi:hypothetical protein
MDRPFARHQFAYTKQIYRVFHCLSDRISPHKRSSYLAVEPLESSRDSTLKHAHRKDNEREEEGPLQQK